MNQSPPAHSLFDSSARSLNPWLFVPILYFMQMIPNQIVTGVFVVAYKKLDVPNAKIAVWTSLVSLPWTLKLFWSPLVDLNFTKRRWVTAAQAMIAVGLIAVAWAVQTSLFWPITLACLFLLAILSATHDIACDGLYILSLNDHQRAGFVGVLTTSARLGKMFCLFVIVGIAGYYEEKVGVPRSWMIAIGAAALIYGAGAMYNFFMLPRPAADQPAANSSPGENRRNMLRTATIIFAGICLFGILSGGLQLIGHAIFRAFGKPANWQLELAGVRLQSIWLMGGLICIVPACLATTRTMRGTVMAEAFVSYLRQPGIGAILSFILLYRLGEAMVAVMSRLFILGRPDEGGLGFSTSQMAHIDGAVGVIGIILGGLAGGYFVSRLGLRKSFFPLAICMHLPNLLYVWAAWHRHPPLGSIYVVAFVDQFGYGFGYAGYMLYLMHVATRAPMANEDGGSRIEDRKFKNRFQTTHYAIGTGLGALGIMLAGILSGIIQASFGYFWFFVAVCVLTIPGMLTLLFIPLDEKPAIVNH